MKRNQRIRKGKVIDVDPQILAWQAMKRKTGFKLEGITPHNARTGQGWPKGKPRKDKKNPWKLFK